MGSKKHNTPNRHQLPLCQEKRVRKISSPPLYCSWYYCSLFICPGTDSLLFRANVGRQCTMALSIPVQLLPCSRVEAALLQVESDQKVMSSSQHHWILPTSPGNTCVQLCSENYALVILSLLEYLVPVQVASNYFFFP